MMARTKWMIWLGWMIIGIISCSSLVHGEDTPKIEKVVDFIDKVNIYPVKFKFYDNQTGELLKTYIYDEKNSLFP